MMSMGEKSFRGLLCAHPELAAMFTIEVKPTGFGHPRQSIHILEVWEVARWVTCKDAATYIGISPAMLDIWIKDGRVTRAKAPFRSGMWCISFEQVLHMQYLVAVKKLVGIRRTHLDIIEGWAALGPDIVTLEAARQATEQNEECADVEGVKPCPVSTP